jgi:hypothetical protein
MTVGTQLQCYMVLVTLPIDPDRIATARERLKKLRDQAETLKAWALHYDEDRGMYENIVPDIVDILEKDEVGAWDFCSSDEEFAEVFLEWATDSRLDEILECITLKDPAKDMAWRELPNGATILVAGGDSYGGDPDGFGFSCLKDLDRFGLFEPLGIV